MDLIILAVLLRALLRLRLGLQNLLLAVSYFFQLKMASDQRSEELCAIFVHAGAGFHSLENEKKHLESCEK